VGSLDSFPSSPQSLRNADQTVSQNFVVIAQRSSVAVFRRCNCNCSVRELYVVGLHVNVDQLDGPPCNSPPAAKIRG
jgi:hypothetical protein